MQYCSDLWYKSNKIRVCSLFLIRSGYYICESIMWSGGKHKSDAPLDLQDVWFGWSKAHCDAATDGRSNSKKAYRDTPRVLVKVESCIFPADFVILYWKVNFQVPIILGRPFLATGRALVDMEKGQMKFPLNNVEVNCNICRSLRQSSELQLVYAISYNMGETSGHK